MKKYQRHLQSGLIVAVIAFAAYQTLGYQRATPAGKTNLESMSLTALQDSDISEQPAKTVVRVYDVQPLLRKVSYLPPPEGPQVPNQSQGQSLFQNQQHAPAYAPGSDERAIDELKVLITNNVATITWKDNGGDIGSISNAGSLLTIEQTPDNHRKVERLLHVLNGEP